MKKIEQWLGKDFESSSSLTPEFQAFHRDVKRFMKKELKENFEVDVGRGHFYFSGFAKNKLTGKYAYFSTSDVRHSPDDWFNSMLVRTAQNDRDYTGGVNCYTKIVNISDALMNLTR